MKIAAYLRVSHRDSEDSYSIPLQRHAIDQFCQQRGWSEVVYYEDVGRSAWKDDPTARPAFAQMLADAEAGLIQHIVVYRVDRWARSVIVALRELAALQRLGVGFASVTESDMDFTTPHGKAFLGLLAIFSQLYSDQLSERTRHGLAAKRRAGGFIGGLPYGARRASTGALEVHPDYGDTLALLLTLAASHGGQAVASELNRRGVPTWRGHHWQSNTVYQAVEAGRWLLDQPPPWPALYRAAATRPKLPTVPKAGNILMLTSLARCVCGGRLTYLVPDERGIRYFSCRNHSRARPTGYSCPAPRRREVTVYHEQVAAWVAALPDLRTATWEEIDTSEARATLVRRRRLLGIALADDTISEAEYAVRLRMLDDEETRLPPPRAQRQEQGRELYAAQQAFASCRSAEQNEFLRAVLSCVVIDGGTATPQPRDDFRALLEEARCST